MTTASQPAGFADIAHLIAEYQTHFPDKALLRAKLREFYLQDLEARDEGGE